MKSQVSNEDMIANADIANGIPQPIFEKEYSKKTNVVYLPKITDDNVPQMTLYNAIRERKSRRSYKKQRLPLQTFSFLLWATQGVREVVPGYLRYIKDGSGRNYLRTVATGGCVNAFDTYLAILNAEGINIGIWRYLPLEHAIVMESEILELPDKMKMIFTNGSQNQSYTSLAGVVFFWCCTPYRGEWRYKETAHRLMLMDVGHISEQLYLAAEASNCNNCAIGAFLQKEVDNLLGLDGEEQFAVLCSAVGVKPD
jgi:SagB-type dehydrogenase family enzyme